jgi:peptidoglycan/xylan/chitin deacetylase (PgdA/CDA1 family)
MTPSANIAAGAAAAAGAAVLSHALFAPRSGLLYPTTWRGRSDQPRIALTFDDGPWPGSTDVVLDTLARAGARATFFVIGRYAKAHPALIRRIHAEGHVLANHTHDHHRTGLFHGVQYWRDQIRHADEAIAEVTGVRPRYFRPPMGFKSPPLARALKGTGHRLVAWSRRAGDGVSTSPDRILGRLSQLHAGDIVLLHDGRDPASNRALDSTLIALPTILNTLAAQGIQAVGLDDLLQPNAVA